jgi:peroxiredoxin
LQFISDSQQEVDSQTKIFGVMGEDEKVVEDYVERNNIKIPILIDADGSLLHKLDLKYFPSSFKLNDGVIKKVFFGFPQDKKSLIELANY